MAISVQCPSCGKKIKAGEQWAGKTVKCPGCGERIAIPSPMKAPVISKGEQIEHDLPATPKPEIPLQNNAAPQEASGKSSSSLTLYLVLSVLCTLMVCVGIRFQFEILILATLPLGYIFYSHWKRLAEKSVTMQQEDRSSRWIVGTVGYFENIGVIATPTELIIVEGPATGCFLICMPLAVVLGLYWFITHALMGKDACWQAVSNRNLAEVVKHPRWIKKYPLNSCRVQCVDGVLTIKYPDGKVEIKGTKSLLTGSYLQDRSKVTEFVEFCKLSGRHRE